MGDDYPNGTVEICEFSGRFASPMKVDDYTYTMLFKGLELARDVDDEWIEDGIRYHVTLPYGLEKGTDFILYLPGKATASIPQECIEWVAMPRAWGENIPANLPCYVLYNVTEGYAFSAEPEAGTAIVPEATPIPAQQTTPTPTPEVSPTPTPELSLTPTPTAAPGSGSLVFSDSSSRALTESDVAGKSNDQLQMAINEIYARHGYIFKRDDLKEYFSKFSWYSGTTSDMDAVSASFSDIEAQNVEFLEDHMS